MIDARADEALIHANRALLRDDELVIVMGKLQPDRFSGGLQLTVQQIWDLASARCRFGKYFRVAVNGVAPKVHELLREFPAHRELSEQGELVRGLPVRLRVRRPLDAAQNVVADLQLGDEARVFPTDAAIASWAAQAADGLAEVVYE